jgi:histidinol-phosphate aminotransferase
MNKSTLNVIKSRVKVIGPYTLKQSQAKIKINQNENPYDLPESLKAEVLKRMEKKAWSRYPDFVPQHTIEKLAQFTGWMPEGILIGNGSNELLENILMVTVEKGRKVVIPQPTFALYKLLVTILGGDMVDVLLTKNFCFDLEAIREALDKQRPDVLILCSPNNPTGCIIPESDLEQILKSFTGLVIVDEAYQEFSGQTAFSLLRKFDNLILTRTFSKAMSMAGLRMGYILAHPKIAEHINKAKLPYNVNVFTLTAAEVVLENFGLLQERIDRIIAERERVFRELKTIPGVTPYQSYANFILFETAKSPETVFNALLKQGVLIRDVSRFPMLGKALRVSIGTPEENDRFLAALKEVEARRAQREG